MRATIQLGVLLSEDLLPDAIEYFSGKGDVAGQTDDDSEDELNDESGDENEEIDLEEEDGPARKRRKA